MMRMNVRWLFVIHVLALVACTQEPGGSEPTGGGDDGKTDGWFTAPECPEAQATATLTCEEGGGNSLVFVHHQGSYQLSGTRVVESYQESLVCTYVPVASEEPSWTSEYVVDGEARSVSSVEQLRELVEQVSDLDDEARAEVQVGLPEVNIWYDIGWFNSLSLELSGLSTGLESFDASDDPENRHENKTVFVIDHTANDAGFGGTYRTGSLCVLEIDTF
jgi:hypothetical protein